MPSMTKAQLLAENQALHDRVSELFTELQEKNLVPSFSATQKTRYGR